MLYAPVLLFIEPGKSHDRVIKITVSTKPYDQFSELVVFFACFNIDPTHQIPRCNTENLRKLLHL